MVRSALVEHGPEVGEVVASLSRLGPLVGCSQREFAAVAPLLEQVAALLRAPGSPAEVERVLAANGVDSPAALRCARSWARCFARPTRPLGAQQVRDLAHQRCSDARLLVRVCCEAVGGASSAGLLLHVLDPLLVLRRIQDYARGGSPGFNLVTEYVRLFGPHGAQLQLRREQDQLVRTLLCRWERLPRPMSVALWPVVFEESEWNWLIGWLPVAALVRWAGRRLADTRLSVPHVPAADGFRIVPAEHQHCEQVVGLRGQASEQLGCARDGWNDVAAATRIDLAAGELHVVADGPEVVGSVVLARRGAADAWTDVERAEPALYASGLVLDQRRPGPLTGRVVEQLRRWSAERGIRWLRGEIDSEHSGLIHYYGRLGFEPVREVVRGGRRVRAVQAPVDKPEMAAQ